MNTCGTCKYKTLDENKNKVDVFPRYFYVPDIGYVYENMTNKVPTDADGDVLPLKTFFLCGRIKQKEYLEESEKVTEKAIVMDGSGYYAALCVDDDFGCNQWEAK